MSQGKPRVIKDYDKLDPVIQEQIKLNYPDGFSNHLISFTNKDGQKVSALTFEADDFHYLVRMTISEAKEIIEQDDDYDEDGILKETVKGDYEDKYMESDILTDNIMEQDFKEEGGEEEEEV